MNLRPVPDPDDRQYLEQLEVVADEMREAMTGLARAIARLEQAIERARELKDTHDTPA
jgi:hypothetical protein